MLLHADQFVLGRSLLSLKHMIHEGGHLHVAVLRCRGCFVTYIGVTLVKRRFNLQLKRVKSLNSQTISSYSLSEVLKGEYWR